MATSTFPFKYGKRAPKVHARTLWLPDYLGAEALPPPEVKRGWEYAVRDGRWGMLGNDTLGDCAEAMALHYIMAATANATGTPATFITQDAIDLYTAVTGYDPNDPNTDQGTALTDLLAYWQSTGIKGHRILAWATFDYTNPTKLNQAIDIFGAALIGTSVTASMEQQFSAKQPWNSPFTGGSQGLHAIPIVGFGRAGRTCITWGTGQPMDLNMPQNFDEGYVVITKDWLTKAQTTPVLALNLAKLEADIKLMAA